MSAAFRGAANGNAENAPNGPNNDRSRSVLRSFRTRLSHAVRRTVRAVPPVCGPADPCPVPARARRALGKSERDHCVRLRTPHTQRTRKSRTPRACEIATNQIMDTAQ